MVVFLWCGCGGVLVVVFLWRCFCGGVLVVVFLWWCTKYYSSTTKYYSVLQSTTPVLLRTTKYYSSTTPYYKVLLQYYSVLQSTTPYYKVLLQYYKVLLRTTKYYSSTTKYYSSTTKYYSVLQTTTPVLLRTTKYYSSTTPYYKVLLQYYKVLLRTTKYYSSTTPYYKVLLQYYSNTTLYYKVLLQYYSVLQSTTPVLLQYYSVLQSTTPAPLRLQLLRPLKRCQNDVLPVLLRTTPVLQKLPKRAFRARLPQLFKEQTSKTSISCEASSKFHRTSFQNEHFVRGFRNFSRNKLPKRAFRARLPPNFTERASKTSVSRDASDNFHRKSFQKDRFVRGFLQISQKKLPKRAFRAMLPPKFTEEASKTSVSCEASSKIHRTSFQNERFAPCFRQFSQKKLPK